MDEKIEKLPHWLRYTLALPYSFLLVIILGILFYISNSFFATPDSIYTRIMKFLFQNGINIIIFFYGMNNMLPKYKFKITLILSLLIGIFYSMVEGITIFTNGFSLEYGLAFLEIVISLIISCYYSFNKKYE